jgi:hypothetical protein
LWNNAWSFAGHEDRQDVNQMSFQYFINYNLNKGYFLTWQPTITANWKAPDGSKFVVPYGGGVGRIMKIGAQPGQYRGAGLRQRRASTWRIDLVAALSIHNAVSKVTQRIFCLHALDFQ